jgi:NAD(P)-dependent dehydrogenase (short-subunit alcohol dehydrogenase family)
MQVSVQGLRFIITEGASGIGRAVAEAFMENGARVHIGDVDATALKASRHAWPELGTSLADVSAAGEVDALFKEAVDHLGGLDVLVDNAAIAGPTARVEDVPPEDWNRTLAVNTNGQFYSVFFKIVVAFFEKPFSWFFENERSSSGLG